MPTARHPAILASWPTTDPVAPAAPETSTVSPATGRPTLNSPQYAVTPVVPRTDSIAVGGNAVSILTSPSPLDTCHSVQPVEPITISPTAKPGWWLSTTSLIPLPRITSPIAIGAT